MESQPVNSPQIVKEQMPFVAANVANAVLLLYKTVKERKGREFLEKMKYGKYKRV